MRQYNIPYLWRRDIATCGTYPDALSRNMLWHQWTDLQKEHAQSMYNPVFDRLEELCKLKMKHSKYFGEEFYCAYLSLNQAIDIDCSKQYTTAQLLKLVDNAIVKENKIYEEDLAMAYGFDLEDIGDWEM